MKETNYTSLLSALREIGKELAAMRKKMFNLRKRIITERDQAKMRKVRNKLGLK
ncbi:MAG: hypothetical protein HZC05_01590 [Candidatus Magasanikbacteria bacterium]|nr:hypothetical protein [Candidatus Magasanikbacteria bacterium]